MTSDSTTARPPSVLAQLAQRHLIMHYTPSALYETAAPRVIVRAEGSHVWDEHGTRFIDGLAGMFCVQIGYSYGERIGQAVSEQLRELPFYTNWSAATPTTIRLAAKLASIAPEGLNRVFFTSSGSEANEAAIKMVRQYHQARGESTRTKFIGRRNAYHGTSYGALSLNGITRLRHRFEPLMTGVRHVSNTNAYRSNALTEADACLALLQELESTIIAEGPETVAGLIVEPVQNSGGCFVPPLGYHRGLRDLCDRYGLLLIADEVVTGFGRIGGWFGSDVVGLEPDLITFAKGVTSGYAALGGLLCGEGIVETVCSGPDGMYMHGGTFGGNPASCAVALANLDVIEEAGLLERVRTNGPRLKHRLESLTENPLVGDVRGTGYQYAIEIVRDHESKSWTSRVDRARFGHEVLEKELLTRGLICRIVTNDPDAPILLQLAPPLVITDGELDAIVEVIGDALATSWETLTRLESGG